jgi:signal transduction histidine kinase
MINLFRHIIKSLFFLSFCMSISGNHSLASEDNLTDTFRLILEQKGPDSLKIDRINESIFRHSPSNPGISLQFSDTAIRLSRETGDSLRLANSFNRRGLILYYLGDYNGALQHYFTALSIRELKNRPDQMIMEYNNIGLVLRNLDQIEEALQYFHLAMRLLKDQDNKRMEALIWNNIGICHRAMGQLEAAQEAFERSLRINMNEGYEQSLAFNLNNLGNINRLRKNHDKAIDLYQQAIKINIRLGNKYEEANILSNLAELHIELANLPEAMKHIRDAETIVAELDARQLSLNLMNIKANYYRSLKDFQQALNYRQLAQKHQDSLMQANRKILFEQLRTLANAEKEIQELEFLKQMNVIQREKLRNQRIMMTGSILLVVLFALLLITTLSNLRIRKRLNQSLNELVEKRTIQLREAKTLAENSDRLKTSFLSNMSHEVRTPMNSLMGFSSILQDPALPEKEKKAYLEHMNAATLRLLRLFENITYLARLDNGDVELSKSLFSPSEVIRHLETKYKQRIRECNFQVELSSFVEEQKTVFSDEQKFRQILEELLDNATKFTKTGTVHVACEIKDEEIQLLVSDTGIGIRKEDLPRVFEQFAKFESSFCQDFDGPGIGLSIVKKNLDLLGGKIEMISHHREGTSAHIQIPLQAVKTIQT